MSVFLRQESREDLEREILRAVKRCGYCYAHDQLMADHLNATTPEQVLAWQTSFCERSGMTCRPYQEEAVAGSVRRQSGVLFLSAADPEGAIAP